MTKHLVGKHPELFSQAKLDFEFLANYALDINRPMPQISPGQQVIPGGESPSAMAGRSPYGYMHPGMMLPHFSPFALPMATGMLPMYASPVTVSPADQVTPGGMRYPDHQSPRTPRKSPQV